MENLACLEKVCICMYFNCLCYEMDISTDMSEEQVAEERDLDLNEEEDIRMDASREEHWRDIAEEVHDKKNIYDLRWEVYIKEKEELINREFLVSVPHPKGENIVWNRENDHIIDKRSNTKLLLLLSMI